MTAVTGASLGVLQASGLTWTPAGRSTPTLHAVDLRLAPRERVLVVGASGSGKSTLLRGLAGLLDPTTGDADGSVRLGEGDPQSRPGSVALLLQDPRDGVVAEHAGRDVAFGPENRALPPPEVRASVPPALGAVGFPYRADRPTSALSGGESARLALAGALALDPEVLLLDEPTAMLDDVAATRVRDAVVSAADATGCTLVVVEHQLQAWVGVCERLVVLDRGRVVADGPVSEVLRTQRDALLAGGVWVPGALDPSPLGVGGGTGVASGGLRWCDLEVVAPDARRLATGLAAELDTGDGLAVVGPSGAGKSTLLRTLAGLDEPAAGRVELRTPEDWTAVSMLARSSPKLARCVAWVPQHAETFFARRTVLDEVRATGDRLHVDDPDARAVSRQRADELVDALGLRALVDADPYAVSGGEQRRVVLAAALAHDPAVLLLDEPTVGQDRQTWAAVVGVIEAARRRGAVVVATTHDPRLAARLGSTLRLEGSVKAELAADAPDHAVRPVVEPGTPPAGRCNPLSLLALAVLAGVGSFWVSTPWVGLVTLAVVVALAPLAVRRLRPLLVRLVPVALAALSVGWSTLLLNAAGPFSPGSGVLAAREVTRILCLVLPGAVVVGLLRPSTLGDALSQRLRLPPRPVVAASAALLRLDDLLELWRSMVDVRRVRGLAPGRNLAARVRFGASLTLALLVRSLRSAQQLALSMDARGFAAVHRRSHALPSTFGWRDAVCVAIGVLLLILPMVLSR